jgi:hypothetical protein
MAVCFRHLWEGYEGPSSDTVEVDVYQHWLEPATEGELAAQVRVLLSPDIRKGISSELFR